MKKTVIILSFILAIVTVSVIGKCYMLHFSKDIIKDLMEQQQQFEQQSEESFNEFTQTSTESFLEWLDS